MRTVTAYEAADGQVFINVLDCAIHDITQSIASSQQAAPSAGAITATMQVVLASPHCRAVLRMLLDEIGVETTRRTTGGPGGGGVHI